MKKIEPIVYEYENIWKIKNVLGKTPKKVCVRKGKYAKSYIQAYCGFDIETTNFADDNTAYMYLWQFSYNNVVILGREWDDFFHLLSDIKTILGLNEHNYLIIWIANLSFEFQFMRHRMNVTHIFAKKKREPLLVEIDNCIEFRDCLPISGGNLKQLAKDYTSTQKLTEIMDYSLVRGKQDILDDDTKNYSVNDVVILAEWSEYIFKNYIIPEKFVPMTKTQLLRREVQKNVPKNLKSVLRICYPPNEEMYHSMMRWLYRGGFVHGNAIFCNTIIEMVHSFDFTSSYPSVMLKGLYPVGIFNKIVKPSLNDWLSRINDFCCMAIIEFENIRSTTCHSIESSSKCIKLDSPLIDNGRVRKADRMTVFLTELDYQSYLEFYEWESIKIHTMWYTAKGYLPKYFTSVVANAYITKAELKKQGLSGTPNYAIAKSKVNSAYGLTVTSIPTNEFYINEDGEWDSYLRDNFFEKEKSKASLLPQWGIYVSALARRNILKTLYALHKDALYVDTDSIKIINFRKHIRFFHEYNKMEKLENKKMCDRLGLDYNIFHDIGCFEWETSKNNGGCYQKFKMLGAKRYIYENQDGLHSTIAGLPKKALDEYCKKHNLNPFEVFADGMEIEISGKLTSHYNDKPTTRRIKGILHHEESSVALTDAPFTLNMDEAFVNLISSMFTKRKEYLHE